MLKTILSFFTFPKKLKFFFILLCFSFFIFFWDFKSVFDFRLFIILPVIIIIYEIFKNGLNLRVFYFPFTVVSLFLLHLAISYTNLSHELISQYFFNFKPILAIFVISLLVSKYYDLLVKNLRKIVNLFIVIFLIDFFLANITNIENIKNDLNLNFFDLFFSCANGLISYSKGVFRENSHLAMISVPILLSGIVDKNLFKKNLISYIFIIFLILNYISFSTTFHVGIVISSLFVTIFLICKKEYKKIFFIFLMMTISILFLLYQKNCYVKIFETQKVFIYTINDTKNNDTKKNIPEKINLTSDVHRNAFLITKYSLLHTNFVGLGLDNFAVGHMYFRNRSLENLSDPTASLLNERDASSNLIKIFAEFGVFIIFPIILFLYFVLRSKEDLYTSIFLISVILVQLVRGAGYFNGGFILFALMIFYSLFAFKKSNND